MDNTSISAKKIFEQVVHLDPSQRNFYNMRFYPTIGRASAPGYGGCLP